MFESFVLLEMPEFSLATVLDMLTFATHPEQDGE